MTVQHELSAQARNFNWLLTSFVEGTSGVTLAVAVSSDGLLMAMSNSIDRATAEQLSAIIAGMASLGHSTARCFGLGGLDQVIIALQGGFLFVSSVSDGSSLGVLAEPRVRHRKCRLPDRSARRARRFGADAGPRGRAEGVRAVVNGLGRG